MAPLPFRQPDPPPTALTADEKEGLVVAPRSVLIRVRHYREAVIPAAIVCGFGAQSAGVDSRILSEHTELGVCQHCPSFTRGTPHDLNRMVNTSKIQERWEVKVHKHRGLVINQCDSINGKNYLVVNYTPDYHLVKVWVLWNARETMFSRRNPKSNARHLAMKIAAPNIEVLYPPVSTDSLAGSLPLPFDDD